MARSSRSIYRNLIVVLAAFVICSVVATSASANPWNFTTCGQTGRIGPDQAMGDAAYTGTSLDGQVTVTNGIQSWTVPTTGTYRIEGWGAAGGTQTWAPGFPGGSGAYISGEFNLVAGEILNIIVGQMGEDTRLQANNAAPGGGGGTFVYYDPLNALPLVAAGGGGSGTRCAATADQAGSAGTAGNPSGSLPNGGADGNGGLSNLGGSSYWAGGGAGWLTDGTGGANPTNYDFNALDPSEHAQGGRSPRNGGLGGVRSNDGNDEGGDGGFGGGGGGGSDNMGGGGGGGYSGGGGARFDPCGNEPGGGGGSYNGGANQTNTAGVNAGDGTVVITLLAAAVAQPIPTLSEWGMIIMSLILAGSALWMIRRRQIS